jgi:hypothetical protein
MQFSSSAASSPYDNTKIAHYYTLPHLMNAGIAHPYSCKLHPICAKNVGAPYQHGDAIVVVAACFCC